MACKMPINTAHRSLRIDFVDDLYGFGGWTGEYHEGCAKPFVSIAHILNLNWTGKF